MEVKVPGPTGEWNDAYFTVSDFEGKINKYLDVEQSSIVFGTSPEVYTLEDGFVEEDRYWIKDINRLRMTADSTVLYRPGIVNELLKRVKHMLNRTTRVGLMIKGPQGVGKSYSLINLTRCLLASKEYVVTFIPDCARWDDMDYLFGCILNSVGVDASSLMYSSENGAAMKKLIRDIDKILQRRGRKWVFIFDQINKIFARPKFHKAKDVGGLPFPFCMMAVVQKEGRIISIISASANNDVSHRENHAEFDEYYHPMRFDDNEMDVLYTPQKVSSWKQAELYSTGRVPWYLNQWVADPVQYSGEVCYEIISSLEKLQDENKEKWDSFKLSSFHYLVQKRLDRPPQHYDRKYLLLQPEGGFRTLKRFFPWSKKHIGFFFGPNS